MRVAVILLAAAAIALGCYDIANPYRAGMFGFDFHTSNNGDQVVTKIYPGSPVERAGLRPGDVIPWSKVSARTSFDSSFRRTGQTIAFPVVRDGKTAEMSIVAAEYTSIKPIEEGPLALAILIIFAATGVLVILRGADRKTAHWLAFFLAGYAMQMAFFWFSDVAPSPGLSFAGSLLGNAVSWANAYLILLLVAHFPPFNSRFRTVLRKIMLPAVSVAALVQMWIYLVDVYPRTQLFEIAGSSSPAWFQQLVWAFISFLTVAAAIEGMLRVDEEHRAQMRWVGGAVILSESSWLIMNFSLLINPNPQSWFPVMSLFQDVPLLAIAYAILRHRLVDISIVFSRAAVFGFVSITLVALFIAGEWVAAQILERGLGADAANGWLGKIVPLAIALAVGLSARSIHGAVEKRLNVFFFARRERSLAALRRLALEADVVTNKQSLLDLTYESVRDNIEGRYAAIYLLTGTEYERTRSSDDGLPPHLDMNDPVVVRLRRWNEPFEVELGEHGLSEALLLPMTVRGALLGAIVCGPKRERTHYLAEEIDALALVAHRAGTTYELLVREGPKTGAAGIDVSVLRELIRAELQALSAAPT
ncbi:MAG TPA: GAF domain-containing protein [Candidatus Rubrimentiphilum sp.]|nr:GAF domain-containing protein [Candidatus Rubrimentiphilum sp.]